MTEINEHGTGDGTREVDRRGPVLGEVVKDPVCGMAVDPATAHAGSAVDGGITYFFCSARCAQKFRADPGLYVSQTPRTEGRELVPGKGLYTCPMHPEIVRDGPGNCPICGMALEPMSVTAEEQESAELVDMQRRFVLS